MNIYIFPTDGFVHSTENLTTSTWKFQNEIQSADSTK